MTAPTPFVEHLLAWRRDHLLRFSWSKLTSHDLTQLFEVLPEDAFKEASVYKAFLDEWGLTCDHPKAFRDYRLAHSYVCKCCGGNYLDRPDPRFPRPTTMPVVT